MQINRSSTDKYIDKSTFSFNYSIIFIKVKIPGGTPVNFSIIHLLGFNFYKIFIDRFNQAGL